MTRSRIVLVLALVAVASACAAPGPEASRGKLEPESRLEEGRLSVEVEGGIRFRYEREDAPLRIASIGGQGWETVHFLSVGSNVPLKLPNGKRFRVAFDLIGWKGDGRYEIAPAGVATTVPGVDGASPVRSSAFVEFLGSEKGGDYRKYEHVTEPCDLTIARAGSTGSLSCTRLEGFDGRAVSLQMDWDGVVLKEKKEV